MYDCEHYDNDDVMADLGRTLIDMYIGQMQQSGDVNASTLVVTLAQYVSETDETQNDDGEEEGEKEA